MSNITEFIKKKPTSMEDKSIMYRVIDINSPFYCWEGWLLKTFEAATGDGIPIEYIQIQCTHHGFYFPYFTFVKEQLVEV